jgi:hypothetical protein
MAVDAVELRCYINASGARFVMMNGTYPTQLWHAISLEEEPAFLSQVEQPTERGLEIYGWTMWRALERKLGAFKPARLEDGAHTIVATMRMLEFAVVAPTPTLVQ